MAFANRLRKIGQILYAQNQPRSLDMPRKDLYRFLILRLTGILNIATLGAPTNRLNSPFNLIKRIELIADGKDTIKSLSGPALLMKNFYLFGRYGNRTIPTWATGAMTFYGTLVLPFAQPKAVREADTFFDSGRLSTLELKITWGSMADIFATAPTTYTETSGVIDVHLAETINLGKPLNLSIYKETTLEKQMTASATEFQVLLPVGNIFRGFLIETEVNGDPKQAVINDMQFRSGTTVFYRGEYASLQEGFLTTLGIQDKTLPGYHYVEFCPEGRLVDALNASNLSMLEFIANTTLDGAGVNYIRIYPDELILPRR